MGLTGLPEELHYLMLVMFPVAIELEPELPMRRSD
jgi:hypothetical protein